MRVRGSALLMGLLAAVGAAPVSPAIGETTGSPDAAAGASEDQHIVVVHDDAGPLDGAVDQILADVVGDLAPPVLTPLLTRLLRDRVTATHDTGLRSFVLAGVTGAALEALAAHPAVASIEADRPMVLAGAPTGVDRIDADRLPAARLGSGRDVDAGVAVIDTGVDLDHPDLRVVRSWDCTSGTCRSGGDDRDGHGTHVAGITAARDDANGPVGVAPGARVWSLKVLTGANHAGSVSRVLAALDVVAGHADQIDVANISLSGQGRSEALDDGIRRLAGHGVTVVVAAGNAASDASGVTPANAPDAVTVSAIVDTDGRSGGKGAPGNCGRDDRLAAWSNTGRVVDVAAPGGCITSLARDGGTRTMSGTSMAAPHVAGAVAQYIVIHDLEGTARARAIRARMLSDWTTPQGGACGFAGGVSAEPLLLLVPCGQRPNASPAAPRPAPSPTPEPAPAPDPEARIQAVDLQARQQLLLFRDIIATVMVTVEHASPEGAVVRTALLRDGKVVEELRGQADEDGTVGLRFGGVRRGCHELRVTSITVDGRVLHPPTPANEVCVR